MTSSPAHLTSISLQVEESLELGAVLFDMDGTVADSEPLWFEAEAAYIVAHGAEWNATLSHSLVGKPLSVTTSTLAEHTGSGDSHEEVGTFLIEYMVEATLSQEPRLRPGIMELVEEVREAGIPRALVTSSHRSIAEAFLTRLPEGSFDVVVTSQDTSLHKPHPDPYLLAMELLGVEAKQCLVIEDSPSGVGAGIEAGARVIAIPCMVDIEVREGLSRVSSAEELTLLVLRSIAAGTPVDTLAS